MPHALGTHPARKGRGMAKKPQPGDRVRVTTRTAVPDCLPGDKGTVLRGAVSDGGELAFFVALDYSTGKGMVLFTEDEIEVDG